MWKNLPQLVEIVNDVLTVGNSIDDLDSELRDNTWLISMSKTERCKLTESDLVDFFTEVIINREKQLKIKSAEQGMYFYLWHDRQASQLRFSLISDFHTSLPFACEIMQANLSEIIGSFLKDDDVITWSELDVADFTQENSWEYDVESYTLKVYQKHLGY